MQRGTTMRVGGALRSVRESRGLAIEEAARDTRVRREFLEAIEEEDFGRLLGDVHVRGCLRTYASYLRVSPDKVVAAYAASQADGSEPATGPPRVQTDPPALGRPRRRDNHRLAVMVAATVLVLAAAFGVLSARQPAPPPADLPSEAPPLSVATDRAITVGVLARRPVDVTITADGAEPERYSLEAGEGRSFEAKTSVTVRLAEGDTARVTVSGVDEGYPGRAGKPWQETYSFEVPSPSP